MMGAAALNREVKGLFEVVTLEQSLNEGVESHEYLRGTASAKTLG